MLAGTEQQRGIVIRQPRLNTLPTFGFDNPKALGSKGGPLRLKSHMHDEDLGNLPPTSIQCTLNQQRPNLCTEVKGYHMFGGGGGAYSLPKIMDHTALFWVLVHTVQH